MNTKVKKSIITVLALGTAAAVIASAAVATNEIKQSKKEGKELNNAQSSQNNTLVSSYRTLSQDVLDKYSKLLSTTSYLVAQAKRNEAIADEKELSSEDVVKSKVEDLEKTARSLAANELMSNAKDLLLSDLLSEEDKQSLKELVDQTSNATTDLSNNSEAFANNLKNLEDKIAELQDKIEASNSKAKTEKARKALLDRIEQSKELKDSLLQEYKDALDNSINEYTNTANDENATEESLKAAKDDFENKLMQIVKENDREKLVQQYEEFKTQDAYTSASEDKKAELDQLIDRINALDLSNKEDQNSYEELKEQALAKMDALKKEKALADAKTNYLSKVDQLNNLAENGGHSDDLNADVAALSEESKAKLNEFITNQRQELNQVSDADAVAAKETELVNKYVQLLEQDKLKAALEEAKADRDNFDADHQEAFDALIAKYEAILSDDSKTAEELKEAVDSLHKEMDILTKQQKVDKLKAASNEIKEADNYSTLSEEERSNLDNLLQELEGLDLTDAVNNQKYEELTSQLEALNTTLANKLLQNKVASQYEEFKAYPKYDSLTEEQKEEIKALADQIAAIDPAADGSKEQLADLQRQFHEKAKDLKEAAIKQHATNTLNSLDTLVNNGGTYKNEQIIAFNDANKAKWAELKAQYEQRIANPLNDSEERMNEELDALEAEMTSKFEEILENDKVNKTYSSDLARLNTLLNNGGIKGAITNDEGYAESYVNLIKTPYDAAKAEYDTMIADNVNLTTEEATQRSATLTQLISTVRSGWLNYQTNTTTRNETESSIGRLITDLKSQAASWSSNTSTFTSYADGKSTEAGDKSKTTEELETIKSEIQAKFDELKPAA